MRKSFVLTFKYYSLIFMLVWSLMIGCQEEESTAIQATQPHNFILEPIRDNSVQVTRISDSDPNEHRYNQMLETAVYGLLELSQDARFRLIVHEEVNKQFGGDDHVLLTTLNRSCKRKGIDLLQRMKNSIGKHVHNRAERESYLNSNQDAINGFDYFEEKAYPQIYIPFFKQVDMSTNPIIVLYLDLEDEETALGYRLNKLGQLEEYLVDEQMTRNQLIWVVSVNETIASEEELNSLMANPRDSEVESERPNSNGSRSWTTTAIFVDRIYITDKKESLFNGKAEVSVIARQMNAPVSSGSPGCNSNENASRKPFVKVGNGDTYTETYGNDKFGLFYLSR